jgi:hypothetical protein
VAQHSAGLAKADSASLLCLAQHRKFLTKLRIALFALLRLRIDHRQRHRLLTADAVRRGSPGTMRLSSYERRNEAETAEERTIKAPAAARLLSISARSRVIARPDRHEPRENGRW